MAAAIYTMEDKAGITNTIVRAEFAAIAVKTGIPGMNILEIHMVNVRHTLTERADLGIGRSEELMFIFLFNLTTVNPQPESGSVAKNVMGKIQ
eukprot:484197-Pelagomonas_calceolata.AAC.1